ncbi:type II toxin-antitoxin system VapC family toxin [Methylobacterium sp. E-066]|uniref:type II toxin-antitoxin system VapC family toxin n=1 Tax=Methylobacterium sp. E-066 TaxID=2836584 RepID=UPI001FB9C0DF|nr:type II toxin-antitoxin system VapC family toxin [Methylobacterium sp. E-066]MCJ2141309.1 type II toxin-antitoxin system VapC family toxin [Methylobacterium sp. E-066]
MIALDSSALVAIALDEPEGRIFDALIVRHRAIVGTPTLLETRMVLGSLMPAFADAFLDRLIATPSIRTVDFGLDAFRAAADAFNRYGKGQGHIAYLNFGDCLSYAVAKVHAVPLLFKGNDFIHTDLVPAYSPSP